MWGHAGGLGAARVTSGDAELGGLSGGVLAVAALQGREVLGEVELLQDLKLFPSRRVEKGGGMEGLQDGAGCALGTTKATALENTLMRLQPLLRSAPDLLHVEHLG